MRLCVCVYVCVCTDTPSPLHSGPNQPTPACHNVNWLHQLLRHHQVFSFKLRGAYNKMAQLSPEALARGVITSSAGNHAQGVALAAAKLVW